MYTHIHIYTDTYVHPYTYIFIKVHIYIHIDIYTGRYLHTLSRCTAGNLGHMNKPIFYNSIYSILPAYISITFNVSSI